MQKYANLVEVENAVKSQSNAYKLAKFRFDTAENESAKKLQKFCKLFVNFAREVLAEMLDSNSFTDVTFVVEGREIAAHRVVLALLSDHFRAAFSAGSCQFMANFRQNFARFRLYRHRSLQVNTTKYAFFSIFQNLIKSTTLSD